MSHSDSLELRNVPHYVAKRQQRHRQQFDVLFRDWQAYDRQCKKCREQQMHDRKFESRQDDPDDVHDQRNCATWRFGFSHLPAERRYDAPGELEALYAERNAYDRKAQQDATEDVANEDYKTAEYEKHDIAKQRHKNSNSAIELSTLCRPAQIIHRQAGMRALVKGDSDTSNNACRNENLRVGGSIDGTAAAPPRLRQQPHTDHLPYERSLACSRSCQPITRSSRTKNRRHLP